MTVDSLVPDTAAGGAAQSAGASSGDAQLFGSLTGVLAQAGGALARAQHAESAFAAGNGSLQEMVFDRVRADAILNVASAAASKATQSLNTIMNMQV